MFLSNVSRRRSRALDILIIALAVLPIIGCMVLKVLTNGVSDDISITGPTIYFTVKMPIQDMPITESQVNSLAVILCVFWLCIFFTRGLKTRPDTKRQVIAEWIVEKVDGLISDNMGSYFKGFAPFVTAIMALSALSSLLSLCGLFAPTSDMNIVGGWAILVFILITYYKMKCGPIVYIKGLASPVLLTPLNVIGEIATPVSMAFRHYGNVLSGAVISVLVGTALQGLSSALLGWLPGVLGEIPFLRIGIPAVLSIYFDLFSGCLQAFIFAMLTMLYVSNGFPADIHEERMKKKKLKNNKKSNKLTVR